VFLPPDQVPAVLQRYIDGLKAHDVDTIAGTVADDLAFVAATRTLDKPTFLSMLRALYTGFPDWNYDYDGVGSTTGVFTGQIGGTEFSSLEELRQRTTEAHAVETSLAERNERLDELEAGRLRLRPRIEEALDPPLCVLVQRHVECDGAAGDRHLRGARRDVDDPARQRGQRAIFCPLPLADGVSTISTSPCSSCTRSASINALSAKADPVSRWHQRQWQQCTNSGFDVIR